MSCAASADISGVDEGNSGATVASLIFARFEEPYIEPGSTDGSANSAALCAPRLLDARYGPSTCAPRRDAALGKALGFNDGRIYDSRVNVDHSTIPAGCRVFTDLLELVR